MATGQSITGPEDFDPTGVVVVAVVLGVIGFVAVLVMLRHQRTQTERLVAWAERAGFASLDPEGETVQGLMPLLLDVMRMAWQRPTGVYVGYAARGHRETFEVYLVQVLGMVGPEVVERLVVVCRGFEGKLPAFELRPSNWMSHAIHGQGGNCAPPGKFAERYYVFARDKEGVRNLLSDKVQALLLESPNLAAVVGGNLAGVYDHSRTQPRDLERFVQTTVALASVLRKRAIAFSPSAAQFT
ncbi:MAG: hypothetical protein WDZ31_13780 [Phycisphaeraceae bacterium]